MAWHWAELAFFFGIDSSLLYYTRLTRWTGKGWWMHAGRGGMLLDRHCMAGLMNMLGGQEQL
jgi:hypothetical protein